jgi:acyl-CoA synthetase (AMP-forming)/AMP-acid ligase II
MPMLAHESILKSAETVPDRDALRFLANGEEVTERLTYGVLAQGALNRADWLVDAGLEGQPVALVIEPGALFIETLVACLFAGAIVSPLPVPRQALAVERVIGALADLRPAAILTTSTLACLPALAARQEIVRPLDEPWIAPRAVLRRREPTDPAIIQYSSGSTAEPRGIVLTHGNIAANLAMMRAVSLGKPGDISVSWLPHSHDMGLFGTILAPLWHDSTAVLMPPAAFLRRPMRWLRAMSEHGGTHSTAPNFGYGLAARRAAPDEMAGLDLSSWRVAFIGAEPTLPATLEVFARATEPAGFRPSAFQSCYGLAEATLLCTSGLPQVENGRVTCGSPVAGCELLLRSVPAISDVGSGEILVAGPHVSPGLWDPAVAGGIRPFDDCEMGSGGKVYVPTGDLGRFAQDGSLIVLDRLKDILPVRSGSLGPTEVEDAACGVDERIEAAAAVPDARPGSYVVRLALEANERRMTETERHAVASRITNRLAERFGIETRVWFFAPWELPRTTSGKIRRFAVRNMISSQETNDAQV